MKRYIQVESVSICPFIGKECIQDGWKHWDQKIVYPCKFFDENAGMKDEEPCLIMRAVRTVCGSDAPATDAHFEMPWTDEKKE